MARSASPTKAANGTERPPRPTATRQRARERDEEASRATGSSSRARSGPGRAHVERRFTRPGVHPYDTVEWESREATITNEHGETVFEQKDLEFPKAWSQLATQVVASKYFRGHLGTPERERSAKQMIDRVADTIADWGIKDAYFATDEDAEAFRNELKDILLKQRAASTAPSGSTSASTRTRSAAPASSTASTTRWSPS